MGLIVADKPQNQLWRRSNGYRGRLGVADFFLTVALGRTDLVTGFRGDFFAAEGDIDRFFADLILVLLIVAIGALSEITFPSNKGSNSLVFTDSPTELPVRFASRCNLSFRRFPFFVEGALIVGSGAPTRSSPARIPLRRSFPRNT